MKFIGLLFVKIFSVESGHLFKDLGQFGALEKVGQKFLTEKF